MNSELIRKKVGEREGELINLRRDLHRHPEKGPWEAGGAA
jgi:metal-dependent amidase/aminoacylase/carboxypeptidase family protein